MLTANLVRVFDPDPSDDFVAKRELAIKDVRAQLLKKTNFIELMEISSGLCCIFRPMPVLADSIATIVETSIKKQSVSFVRDNRDLEMGVYGIEAGIRIIKAGQPGVKMLSTSDVFAISYWSSLSMLPVCNDPKLEDLRLEAIEVATSYVLKNGLVARDRRAVSGFSDLGDDPITKAAFVSATAPTIDALRYNAAIDREEINLLWWVLSGVSDIFGSSLMSLTPVTRFVTSGIEIGAMMRALPAQSHRNLALRGLQADNSLTISELLNELGDQRGPIAESLKAETLIEKAPNVFPLLHAICFGNTSSEGDARQRPLSEWVGRALLERAALRITHGDSRTV
jgi:GTPase-associated system helical domain